MRVHFWQFLRDDAGAPVGGADISVYLAGTTTPAVIYTDEIGGQIRNAAPHLKTNSAGFFEFWVGDDTELYGYPITQKFKVSWDKAGIVSSSIDYVAIVPAPIPALSAVDETGTSTSKTKMVSDLLAKTWTDHTSNNTHIVHGISEVDPTSSEATKNKLVSNAQAKAWTSYEADIAAASWVSDSGNYSYTVTHNLGNAYPSVTIYNTATNLLVTPVTVTAISSTQTKITLSSQLNTHVRLRL